MIPRILIIAGPTASGKSALALAVARKLGGMILNADSMQVYADLRIVTARPDAATEALVPHRLYGILDGAELCTAARWAEWARAEITACLEQRQIPILCGGTGMYLRTLTDGIAPIPEIPETIRTEIRARHAGIGSAALHAELAARDPLMAARLKPADSQRIMRACEVIAATGKSLADWQLEATAERDYDPVAITLLPSREVLYAACDARFQRMIDLGALDEVAGLVARRLPADRPVMKALGVPELLGHLKGEIDLKAAIKAGQQSTRNYAKRQTTWFRHQLRDALVLEDAAEEDAVSRIAEAYWRR